MGLIEHATRELELSGAGKSLYGDLVPKAVLELVEVFAKQGHSGMSASVVRGLFNRVANYEPLCPLTGEDNEWMEVGDGIFQNVRCSHVFRENGVAYDSDGRVFREPSGSCYTSKDSRVEVTFPYVPEVEYVDVQESKDDG